MFYSLRNCANLGVLVRVGCELELLGPTESNPQHRSRSGEVMVGRDGLKSLFPAWPGAFGDGPFWV